MTKLCARSLWDEFLILLLDRIIRICPLCGSGVSGLNIFDGLELISATIDRMGVEKSPPHLPCQGVEERTF